MYYNKKVSVIFSTYNERYSIRKFIDDCFNYGFADEVIVVNNNAVKGTDEEVLKTNAKLIHEKRQGYGYGYRKGLEEATGDYIIMTEPDGTFDPRDFEKLLIYGKKFSVVFGSRTANHSIIDGANMGSFLKWGNWAVAKMIEVLYLTTQLDDVGCTTRLISKNSLRAIEPFFTVGASHFGLEMLLVIVLSKVPFVTIPLNYGPRVGQSSVTGSFFKTFKLGIIMGLMTIAFRFHFSKQKAILKNCAQISKK